MFELFKSRAESIDAEKFERLLEDRQVKMEVEAVKKEVTPIADEYEGEEGDQGDERGGFSHLEYGKGYTDAIKTLCNTLDLKGVLATEQAVLQAVLNHTDPDGSKGLSELG